LQVLLNLRIMWFINSQNTESRVIFGGLEYIFSKSLMRWQLNDLALKSELKTGIMVYLAYTFMDLPTWNIIGVEASFRGISNFYPAGNEIV